MNSKINEKCLGDEENVTPSNFNPSQFKKYVNPITQSCMRKFMKSSNEERKTNQRRIERINAN